MWVKPYNMSEIWKLFALAFLPGNDTNDAYYILPQEGSKGDMIPLTLQKNLGDKDPFIFQVEGSPVLINNVN